MLTKVSDNSVSSLENRPQNTMVHTVPTKQPSKTLIAQNRLPAHNSDILPAVPSVQTEIQAETADNNPAENRDNLSVAEENRLKPMTSQKELSVSKSNSSLLRLIMATYLKRVNPEECIGFHIQFRRDRLCFELQFKR